MFIIIFIPRQDIMRAEVNEYQAPIIDQLKQKVKEIRSIDKIIEVLIDKEDTISAENIRLEYYKSDKIQNKEIRLGKYIWKINQDEIERIRKGTPIFYITEREVYLPIKKGKKMMKGIVEERGIKLQIKKGDDLEPIEPNNSDEIKIEVLKSEEEKYNILQDESNGKLLIINLKLKN
ncbi:MAG: hypothetical protein GF329_21370 [Candidatus Lokiarchaeota archaeon]|nr:hypothetical protein [Candidatus Lokiarchaeota archaeon]